MRHNKKMKGRLGLRMPIQLHEACKEKGKQGDLSLSHLATSLVNRWLAGTIDVGEESIFESH